VPALTELPAGAVTDHVTLVLKLPVPATVAANCTCVPMVAVDGVTVIDVIDGPVGTVTGGVITAVLPPPPHPAASRHNAQAIVVAGFDTLPLMRINSAVQPAA
jgi:hypothetical protein